MQLQKSICLTINGTANGKKVYPKFITTLKSVGNNPPEIWHFQNQLWVRLNRLRIGVSFFCATMSKRKMASISICECGAKEQSTKHHNDMPTHHTEAFEISQLDDRTVAWLSKKCPASENILNMYYIWRRRTLQKLPYFTDHKAHLKSFFFRGKLIVRLISRCA